MEEPNEKDGWRCYMKYESMSLFVNKDIDPVIFNVYPSHPRYCWCWKHKNKEWDYSYSWPELLEIINKTDVKRTF